MVKIDISLENEPDAYNPGDIVQGIATIIVDEDIEARFIDLIIRGTAVCKISMTDFYECNGLDVFINNKIRLWDGAMNDNFLASGSYEYPFHFKIPKSSISTFHGPFCAIEYFIKVFVDRESLFHLDTKKKLELNVVSTLDLNEVKDVVARPVMKSIDSALKHPEHEGLLDAIVRLQKSGYTPGETLMAKISIKNTLTKNIIRAELILVEVVTMTAEKQGTFYCKKSMGMRPSVENLEVKKTEKKVLRVKKPLKIEPFEHQVKQIALKIPKDIIPTSTTSPIVQIEYKLVVKIVLDGIFMSEPVIQNEIPITIGTFPCFSSLSFCKLPVIENVTNGLSRITTTANGLTRSPSVDGLFKFTLEIDDLKMPRSVSALGHH